MQCELFTEFICNKLSILPRGISGHLLKFFNEVRLVEVKIIHTVFEFIVRFTSRPAGIKFLESKNIRERFRREANVVFEEYFYVAFRVSGFPL